MRDDELEQRVSEAVRSFADGADTRVDAVAVATAAMRARRPRLAVPRLLVAPAPAAAALVVVVAMLASTLALVGGNLDRPSPTAAPAATPIATPTQTPSPAPTPSLDGHVTGTWTLDDVANGAPTAGHTSVNVLGIHTNDPRVNGTATWDTGSGGFVDGSSLPDTGYGWAIMTITNDGGTWKGPCKGASWGSMETALFSCELNGTGTYAGLGFYLHLRGIEGSALTLEGVIYSGDIPDE
jgi:hypothetical protein